MAVDDVLLGECFVLKHRERCRHGRCRCWWIGVVVRRGEQSSQVEGYCWQNVKRFETITAAKLDKELAEEWAALSREWDTLAPEEQDRRVKVLR